MPSVFVSYAHSSAEHTQRVQSFVEYLRTAGLTVVIDTDVKSPAGPKEQWPRWMKNQIAAADWVLLFIDETYRRRFDGKEKPGTGLGVNWEGCIVTHELYQAATNNEKFIPVLVDRSGHELIPIELSGATRYFIPSQQERLANVILAYTPESVATSSALRADLSAETAAPSMDEWRQATVEWFADTFKKLSSERRRSQVAKLLGFAADSERATLYTAIDAFIRKHCSAEGFDVESISLIVAEFDAMRTDAERNTEDLSVLTELQDLLLPLCIHPGVKAVVAARMSGHGGAIIEEAVALEIGAELAAASADGRKAGFSRNDEGRIVGEGLLRFVDCAVGNPNPDAFVCEIFRDLAEQLSVALDDEIDDEPDVRKRIMAWTDRLRVQVKAFRTRKRRRFYCVVNLPKNAGYRKTLGDLLARVRHEIPEIVFFELHRRATTKVAEEVVLQILKDRFKNEGKH